MLSGKNRDVSVGAATQATQAGQADQADQVIGMSDSNGNLAEQQALLDRIAEAVAARELTAPAVLFLESMKPLSFLGGQFMAFLSPFIHMVVDASDYDKIAEAIERRENVEFLIQRIEHHASEAE